ncbi:CoA-disulfide reductase [Salisediminibacterium selenitireducens]|uniref:Pyridine nucleotide-disulfide oxidoreductase dimerization region n=1 Tax=Bacillus selenitireducens (strain ATCC 700615 / DSM 15326 / MLS10) TaxID=439292 RepID=D6Y0M2_BACIE|nr:CoA-disulfide reductase [Salisediminibacterium selenitireducens]ADI00590.1 pyridine nucleotide-disulfide oxidoreductase dimerization region [[Bacillus] selenitireducens MLS10]
MNVIVIGGVAAGMSAASKLRRTDPDAVITVFERGAFPTYGACGLPYYISGENDDYERMIARKEDVFKKQGIDVRLKHEVLKVDFGRRQVMVKDLTTGSVWIEAYDRLMIATGTKAIVPPIPGTGLDRVRVLKTMEDGLRMKEELDQPSVRHVTIIGAGYIGIEMAEALRTLKKDVCVIEMAPRILMPFDEEISNVARDELITNAVSLHLSEAVQEITDTGRGLSVKTAQGAYETDYVILSAGVRPATDLFTDTALQLDGRGAVVVDKEMRTNLPDVFAAGDCATVYNKVKDETDYIPLGTNANKGGRIAGENLAGGRKKYTGTLGSAAIKVFNAELGRTGLTEEEAKMRYEDVTTVTVTANDHPGYYPGSTPLLIKLICEKRTRKILGGQIAGAKGAVLRVDLIALAIHNGMTSDELGMVDFCYAPPFAGVWDAVHIASNAVK